MTGTGAPVTEHLRYCVCSELGWYRDANFAPIERAGFIFLFVIYFGGYFPMAKKAYGVNELREMFLSFFES